MWRNGGATPNRENCVYTSCYCEENVWKLCEFIKEQKTASLDHFYVIFISNDKRMVPLWRQKSGHGNRPVIWDYHVILLELSSQSNSLIYDLDTELPFPCDLKLYAAQAFRSDHINKPEYHRKLRLIPVDSFLANFASDRSHMMNSDGTWKMPPPSYPPIYTAESKMNLDDFISMNPVIGWGTVYTLDQFLQKYIGNPSSTSSAASLSSAAVSH